MATLGGCSTPPEGAWILEQFASPEADAGIVALPATITLEIYDTAAVGSSGCNTYQGDVEVSGGRLRFTSVSVTDMFCDNQAVMAAEARFLETLVAHEWRVTESDDSLRLVADDDPRLTLQFTTG